MMPTQTLWHLIWLNKFGYKSLERLSVPSAYPSFNLSKDHNLAYSPHTSTVEESCITMEE